LDITFNEDKEYYFILEFLKKLGIDEKNQINKAYFEFID
jgi:hypothetical protein